MERVALRLIQLELLTGLSSYTRHNNLIRLCYFFNRISHKVIERDELASLKEFVVETVSQFKMCFPQHSSM